MNLRIYRNYLSRAIINLSAAAVVIWFSWYFWQHRGMLNGLSDIPSSDILKLLMLIVANWLVLSWQVLVLFRQLGSKIRGSECLFLTLATAFGNYLPMRAGTALRAHYMKKFHQLSYMEYGGIFSVRLALTLLASGLCGSLGTLYIEGLEIETLPLISLFLFMLIVPLLFCLWQPPEVMNQKLLWRAWNSFSTAMRRIKNARMLVICLALIVVQVLFVSWRFIIVAQILGYEVTLAAALVLASATNLANFIAITPGGLGFREGLMGYTMMIIGTNFSLGLMIGSVDRVVALLLVSVLGGFSFLWIWWRLNKCGSTDATS